jgi:hypothetical protein
MGRPKIQRWPLRAAEKNATFDYHPPLPGGLNPRGVYAIQVSLEGERGQASQTALLRGAASAGVNLGAPRSSLEIAASPLGTCTHFDYAKNPRGAFGGWHDYEALLDEISRAGFKWIRGGARAEKDGAGRWRVSDWTLAPLRAAQKRGIGAIVVIEMRADEPLEDFIARACATIEQTRGLARVYELGNEPNNFGNWRKKFGGPWNGWEPGKGVSPWVREHLKVTNAAAEAIKKRWPDAVLIGLGACSPTNFHALDLGLSPAVDGVVDHPYSYHMAPERVPYGPDLEGRDGQRVGDAAHSFPGLVQSYLDKFKATGRPRTLWLTEFGYTSFWAGGAKPHELYAGYSERAQAAYLVRRFIQCLALPVAAACQYDFIDDYGSQPHEAEANFGLLRADRSRKPAFYAVQRMNSLLAESVKDAAAEVRVEKSPLQPGMRVEIAEDGGREAGKVVNGVVAYGFKNEKRAGERQLAVWSAQPASGEFNGRAATLRVKGWAAFSAPPVAIDLLSGLSFDVPLRRDGADLVLENLVLTDAPLVIKFFKE